MRKRYFFLIVLILLFTFSIAFCATKEDVISALHSSYYVSEKQPSFRLPSKYIQKGEAYLNEHPLTSEQYSRILAAINEGVAFAREVGHTRYKEYTREQYNRALNIILEACAAANVNISEEMEKDEEVTQKVEEVSEGSSTSSPANSTTTVVVKDAVTPDNKPVVIESKDGELSLTISGETIKDVKIDEKNNYVNLSGEILVYSGDIVKEEIKVVSNNIKTTSNKNKYASVVDRNIKLIIGGIFLLIIINIFLICLIFKKKWNKIIKRILESILVVITIALVVSLVLVFYYIKEIKIVYQLYYFLK